MGYLVDTNVLSELRKNSRCDENVLNWFDSTEKRNIYISVLTIGEVRKGIEKIQKRDQVAAKSLEKWLQEIEKNAQGRILPVTNAIANRWGIINAGDPLPVIDSLLAATAIEHDLTLVTRNIADVQRSGAKLLNPFEWGN